MYKRHCHVFKLKDQWYLFDVRSSAASMISPETAGIMLQPDPINEADTITILSNKFNPNALKEAWDELSQIGFLSNSKPVARPISHVSEDPPISKVAFHIAHDCNMRCQYCYAGKGSYNGPRELMSQTVAKKALDLFFSQDNNEMHIGFFGGEPLLNYELLTWVVQEAEQRANFHHKNVTFSINTNGTLLTKSIAQFLVDHKFGVTVSLDGPQEIHDALRSDALGHNTYAKIIANIGQWIDDKVDFLVIRPTFCGNNITLQKAVTHLLALGAMDIGGGLVLEPESPYAITEETLNEVQRQCIELIDDVIDRNLRGDMRVLLFVRQKVDLLLKRGIIGSGCGAGMSSMAVSPDGGLYPCHRLPGYSKVILGTVDGFDQNKRNEFRRRYFERLNNCESCWAKNICGGRCIYLSLNAGKAIEEPLNINCQANKKDCETAIYALCQLRKRGLTSMEAK